MAPASDMSPIAAMTAEEITARRRRARSTAVKLALFAVFVYVAFIIAFINR